MRLRLLPLFAGLCIAPLAGCGPKAGTSSNSSNSSNGSTTSQADNQTLTIISPHGPEIRNEFKRVFLEKHPNANIKFIDQGGTTDDLSFVLAQFKDKKPDEGIGVDLFFGGGSETFLDLEKGNTLQPLPSTYGIPAALGGIPLRSKNNNWVGCALSNFGVLYNKTILTRDNLPVPTSWESLADPKLRRRIELANPKHSGSAHTAYEIILQTNGWQKGWQILTAMAGNSSAFIDSSSRLLGDVQGGQAVMAPAIDFYASGAILKAGEAKLGYVVPPGQGGMSPDPIAILRGAPNAALAKEFVAFAMSPEAQKLWMLKKGAPGGPQQNALYRFPALPALYSPISKDSLIKQNPYAEKAPRAFDSDKAALRRTALDDLFSAVLIDNHAAIKAAWAKNPDPAKFSFVPCTEAELSADAAKWSDPTFKNATTTKWSQAARAHFNQS